MRSLGRWPVPCTTREAAVTFFGGPSPSAEAWAGGLEQRDGGWWPRFDADVMARTLREATARSYWGEWERISCPVLVVGAGRGQLSAADARAMVERGQRVQLVELPEAGHDLHLDSPDEWRAVVSRFLGALQAA
jgi:pimeloyl-ACP methyl ester carboxylesterase